jgi:hypothetical protein
VATETDAARDQVIAARAELAEELETMEASVRAAVDIPARIRRSPAKAAAALGGVGFLALKGPQRIVGAAKRAVRGPAAEMPRSMLPKEIEKTLRKLGDDGDKVRGTLERDFAAYAQEAEKERSGRKRAIVMAAAGPFLARGLRTAAERILNPDDEGFATKLAEVRERAEREVGRAREGGTGKKAGTGGAQGSEDDSSDAGA